MQRHLLIVGAGSVGKRHLRNLAALGCAVSAMDPRGDRLEEAAGEVALRGRFATLEAALDAGGVDGVVICSPPKFHVAQSIACLERGIPVLLEKPVAPTLAPSLELEAAVARTGTPLLLGYTYRWWPALRALRDRVRAGEAGTPLHARCVMSAHLADWHPWERYQDFFMASAELGGGALLDESHFLDLMLWFFGVPAEVWARVEKLSTLEIDTDDNVDAVLVYPSGLRVAIHLDLFGRPHEKYISVSGEGGTLHWSFDPNRVRFSAAAGQEWAHQDFGGERNDMFVEVAREFLAVLDGAPVETCTIADGTDVLRVIEAMRESAATGRTVAVAPRP
jgi:predicted dehydrogenase